MNGFHCVRCTRMQLHASAPDTLGTVYNASRGQSTALNSPPYHPHKQPRAGGSVNARRAPPINGVRCAGAHARIQPRADARAVRRGGRGEVARRAHALRGARVGG